MSLRAFDVIHAMSGQGNVITIPRPYLEFFPATDRRTCWALS